MKPSLMPFIVGCLVAVGGVTGCGYAKQSDLDALRNELYATQDSLTHLWNQTRTFAEAIIPFDTIKPPPKCPPNCEMLQSSMTTLRKPFSAAPRFLRSGAIVH